MKILLLGANGQVGTECQRSLAGLGELICATRTGQLANGADCEQADFDRPIDVGNLVRRLAPEIVVNAAAYTAVDRAEVDSAAAYRANAETPHAIAKACADIKAYLIHYSTDYVFDGQGNQPYRPDEQTRPLGVYGASKLAGEQAVRQSSCQYAILRTAWVYAAHGKNFLLTMLRVAKERDELRVVVDQIGTPTPASLIANITARIVQTPDKPVGIWHLTPRGQTSWHGFAQAIIDGAFDRGILTKRPTVTSISTAEFPTPATRPAWSVMDPGSLEEDWGLTLLDWESEFSSVLDALNNRLEVA